MSGETLATKDAVDPLMHKAYLEELARRLCAGRRRSQGPARLAAVRRSRGLAADADPGRLQRDAARRLTRLAAAAGAADVAVTLEIWPHMIHAWQLWNAQARRRPARARACRRLYRGVRGWVMERLAVLLWPITALQSVRSYVVCSLPVRSRVKSQMDGGSFNSDREVGAPWERRMLECAHASSSQSSGCTGQVGQRLRRSEGRAGAV